MVRIYVYVVDELSDVIMSYSYSIVIIVVLWANGGWSLDNGLALTPPLGWMAWQRYRCIIDCVNYPDDCIRY